MKIAISGLMCSGKTTMANIIKELNNEYKIYSFSQKIKIMAQELFDMQSGFKDRSSLIDIADKMREIDPDVWAKYIIKQTKDNSFCIIDDLRFQNELNLLIKEKDWIFIVINIDDNIRLDRIKNLYPNNYNDHIKNMNHSSEKGNLLFNEDSKVLYLNTNNSLNHVKYNINNFIINIIFNKYGKIYMDE